MKEEEYYRKKYRELQKQNEFNDWFINGCLPLILGVIAFIVLFAIS